MRRFAAVCAGFDAADFPSFSEGLSLRRLRGGKPRNLTGEFPFLFGGTFIEAGWHRRRRGAQGVFPFLFGGTFIEAVLERVDVAGVGEISLPFRRDFH